MRVEVRTFAGMRPQVSADLLQQGEAQSAINCKLTSGALQPYRNYSDILALSSLNPVQTIYRYGQELSSETNYWFQFDSDVNVVKGPIDNDTEERTYWTDGTYPKKTKSDLATTSLPYPTSSLRMGIPAPEGSITATVTGTPTDVTDPEETVVYVVTYVSAWGEEGPPNTASTSVNWQPGQTIELTDLPTAPSGAYNITHKRIYRSAAGSASTKFQLVTLTDLAVATATYNDSASTSALGEVIQTTGWIPPPDDMIGLVGMAGGVLAGFTGNTICLSEPYAPYAWPLRYQRSVDAPIVGIAAFDQSLFVGTTTGIYVLTGIDPASMSLEKLAIAQSCVSKRSVVAMMNGVVWASPDGLCHISASGFRMLTEGLMTRIEWQAYTPESIAGYESDNRYIGFYDTGSTQGGVIFTFGSTATFSETDIYATAGYRDKAKDGLYLVVDNTIRKWDDTGALTYTWTSGTIRFEHDLSMASARVEAATYPVTFKLYADGVLKHTESVRNRYPFRLPAGYRSMRYSFTLTGTSTVRAVEIAPTMSELVGA